MAVNEQIVSGRKYRRFLDPATRLWQRISYWTMASDVEFTDGKNAEEKFSELDSSTKNLQQNLTNANNLANSAKTTADNNASSIRQIQNALGGCSFSYENGKFLINGQGGQKPLGGEVVVETGQFSFDGRGSGESKTFDVAKSGYRIVGYGMTYAQVINREAGGREMERGQVGLSLNGNIITMSGQSGGTTGDSFPRCGYICNYMIVYMQE